MSENLPSKKKDSVRRILLDQKSAQQLDEFVKKLKQDSCKTDASKIVNEILNIFFKSYMNQEYDSFVKKFFDKRSYLKSLINSVPSDELDASIEDYLKNRLSKKKRGRKVKKVLIQKENNGPTSSS